MQTPNSFAAWKQVTPLHNALIDKIISAPLHILVSMRAKTEWILDRDDKGKTVPRKVGLAPVMRDGIEYEFDVCGDMDQENTLVITKSRCPKLAGGVFSKPGKELAETLKEWLGSATAPQPAPAPEATKNPPAPPAAPKKAPSNEGPQNGAGRVAPYGVSEELASIWKRMCSPRGVVKEFEELKAAIEALAGSTGAAEYHRILRQHGVEKPRDFTSSHPAQMCAKEVFALLADLRAAARENQEPLSLAEAGEPRGRCRRGGEVSHGRANCSSGYQQLYALRARRQPAGPGQLHRSGRGAIQPGGDP